MWITTLVLRARSNLEVYSAVCIRNGPVITKGIGKYSRACWTERTFFRLIGCQHWLHSRLPVVDAVPVICHTSEQKYVSPWILRGEPSRPARSSFPLFVRRRIRFHFEHERWEGRALLSVLHSSNFA
jgi:hypothetical protein